MPPQISLLIAEDHEIFRLGLQQVIVQDPQIRLVAEATNGEMALAQIRAQPPQIVLLDVEMPRLSGLDVARALRAERLPSAVILLTQYKDSQHFNAALDLGVRGYVLKENAYPEVLRSIHTVAAGEPFITPSLSGLLLARRARAAALADQRPQVQQLTATERALLKLLAENKTNREIAQELCLSIKTVEHRREHICRKLELKGHHALLHFAIAHGSDL
jgi:DNA-binding NarL/FixJ family response regulator